jgi:hypothetical protein
VAEGCGREEIRGGRGREEGGGGLVKKDTLCEEYENLVISLAHDKIRVAKGFHVHLFIKQSGYTKEV